MLLEFILLAGMIAVLRILKIFCSNYLERGICNFCQDRLWSGLVQKRNWQDTDMQQTLNVFLEYSSQIAEKSLLFIEMAAGAEKMHVLKDPICFDMQGVTMGYGEQAVLTDISLSLSRGEFIAIEGISGSGKTTFIRTLLGLMNPISGRILINGMTMEEVDIHSLWKQIGYVGKNVLLIEESVKRNIVLDLQMDQIKLRQITKILGISDEMLQRSSIENLSSGEKQKIAIARILYQDLPIMVLDEALSNLDEKTKMCLVEYFAQTCKTRGKLVLMISHERRILEKIKRRICIHDGMLTEKLG